MFLPSVHAESDTEILLKFIQENPLGILIRGINSSSQNFFQCTHVPFVLGLPGTGDNESPNPQLRAHIARQNPQVKAMLEAVDGKPSSVLSLV